jgi:hypothetical protein
MSARTASEGSPERSARHRLFRTRRKTHVQKPDFTGEWTLNVEASALSPVVAPVVETTSARG